MTDAELSAIRMAAGLSQIELSVRAGICRHTVGYWECKQEEDRRSWAIMRIAKVIELPDFFIITRAREVG